MLAEQETEVLIVGSGAGALTAAIVAADHGSRVMIIEKSQFFGGTAATSGGVVWVPNSGLASDPNHRDSAEEAFSYIKALTSDEVPDELIRAYVTHAPLMLAYVNAHTGVNLAAIPYTDYHAEIPGGKLGYRSHQPASLDGRKLGEELDHLRPTHVSSLLFGRMSWTSTEAALLITRTKGWGRALLGIFRRHCLDVRQRLRSPRDRYLAGGNALIGWLKLALDARDISIHRRVRLIDLICEGRAVVGAIVEENGERRRILAKRGVVLAAGGFERSPTLRRQYMQQSPDPEWSASQPNNTGDALLAAQNIGAKCDRLGSAWWAPTIRLPEEESARPLFFERALPGSIIINQAGRRYMNEAASYHLVGRWMMERNRYEAPTAPSYVLFDQKFRWRYPMGPVIPILPNFLHSKAVRKILVKAQSWQEMAQKLGVSPSVLVSEIGRFNEDAKRGQDPQFGRGHQAYDRYYGDPKVTPNPNLAALDQAPFYALPINPGDIGSNGGLVINENAQVMHADGEAIAGLYATGNITASVMGASYPGAGATLGPAMTFGYLAALHATGGRR
ncbi:MAG TPA: FAD-binding protein [Steroidobacteraceae bacterium]|jgi:3-oxosteroid 1-dehydrogenase